MMAFKRLITAYLNNVKYGPGKSLRASIQRQISRLWAWSQVSFCWGHCPAHISGRVVIFFPCCPSMICCGLAGLIRVLHRQPPAAINDLHELEELLHAVEQHPLQKSIDPQARLTTDYMGGSQTLSRLYAMAKELKRQDHFLTLFNDQGLQQNLSRVSDRLGTVIDQESKDLQTQMGYLSAVDAEAADNLLVKLKDAAWCLKSELLDNIDKVRALMANAPQPLTQESIKLFHGINTVLNSIDRLEVRGRDSAGISLLFIFDGEVYKKIQQAIDLAGEGENLARRTNHAILGNGSISVQPHDDAGIIGLTLTYKVAAEIGSLGDNGLHLRQEITQDAILHIVAQHPFRHQTISSHTRWASVGAITIANCHPVDNAVKSSSSSIGIIHACLNGDIDNYLELREQYKATGIHLPEEITTDTKIIPLQIEKYLRQGAPMEEAMRLAVNDFEGSHAIAVHTDLAPGKFFLAQRGSGQAVFVGLAADHYLPTSEVYGFVEETASFIKMNGEKTFEGPNGPTQGQLFILDQNSSGGLDGIQAMYYDGTPIQLNPQDIQETQITSRDIDRQDFPHYFLKEISEAPVSVARTLQNRWKVAKDDPERYTIALEESAFPQKILQALAENQIHRIYFIGQGTAGVAAQASADILNFYLNEPSLKISALKASELSGFQLGDPQDPSAMSDALVIAISQSGTTTDTNRTVDMVRARGAYTMAIVNRRDSDITFKVDGVLYTSSGRDIEMSVASTKAFYSQIVAGALLSLKIAQIKGRRTPSFVADEIKALLELPDQMRAVLALKEQIKVSAERLAPMKTYWAAVGSGPNKAAADEIRIKLSELCYKTISSDYVEDKKHIDLSSEPLIIVCASGAGSTVIGDIIKDTAIFRAHKATPVVIADEDETGFAPYAEDVFHVPSVRSHFAPILNTLAGHLWGYYAALAINNGSMLLHGFRKEIQDTVDRYARDGLDVYELILEKSFREEVAQFYSEFRQRQASGRLPSIITHAGDLMLLLKYLTGHLPVLDFEMDFGRKGTALNMLTSLFELLGQAINGMSRPVDAIKHQAKTVTVGTSRISTKVEGILFDALASYDISLSQVINRNVIVLKNLQGIVSRINGSILYKIGGLDALGEPVETTTIHILRKDGILKDIPSRVETDNALKGTKRIIVGQGNVYIGKGRKDGRSIIVIPAISSNPALSNQIEYLLLLNIAFQQNAALPVKIKALGGKYEHIKNIVQENSIAWQDRYLESVPMEDLFGHSAEKIGELIVSKANGASPSKA